MVLTVPTAVSHSGDPYPERSFYILRETEHIPKSSYSVVINIEILKNIPKIKSISINVLSFDDIIFPQKSITVPR